MITKVRAAIIKKNKVLIVKKKNNNTWKLPGGRQELGEGLLECLCRELREELSGKEIIHANYYKNFLHCPKSQEETKTHIYIVELDSYKNIKPSAEIVKAKFIKADKRYNLSPTTYKIIQELIKDSYT